MAYYIKLFETHTEYNTYANSSDMLKPNVSYCLDVKDDERMKGLGEEPYVYFVHSYYVPVCADTIATADYIQPYSAAMHRDNFYACQFHPEKSGKVGEQILRNFLDIKQK